MLDNRGHETRNIKVEIVSLSLIEGAKQWYTLTVRKLHGELEKITSTSHDSPVESSPEPREPKVDEIQPLEFPFQFKGYLLKIMETPRTIPAKRDHR